ncbi:hypothetical protein HXX76_004036 [Chlamydomonas incerta]|uniref:Cell division cycle protein 123 n=1 Tax=Chlamydomonas incerta TaxID=51695 RepID=A0A835TIS5_CHLIN|nr:hypothetical protein HXX76_004036 [Chlamydomonas incerta]|eukprot:KAG2441184.1 hypothetical protein HXX76_004036 [Chlamydomonas incerta]
MTGLPQLVSLKTAIVPLPPAFLGYLQEDGLFVDDGNAGVRLLDNIDAGLVVEGEYRRDDWDDELQAGAPGGLAPQPSPSGPLNAARGGVLSGSGPSFSGAEDTHRERRGSSSTASSSGVSVAGQSADWKLRFPQLRVAIEEAIESLGGRVVPKLNWSAPTDALWVSATNSLACRNADEVVLMLKSSDRVSHDVELLEAAAAAWGPGIDEEATAGSNGDASSASGPEAASRMGGCGDGVGLQAMASAGDSDGDARSAAGGQPPQHSDLHEHAAAGSGPTRGSSCPLRPVLVLKKYQQLRPEREFRCFVRAGRLVAVSQRDVSQAFPALSPDVVAEVRRRVWRFWEERLGSGSRLSLDNCALDVYVPFDSPSWQSVRLVDVNPLLDTTSPLLYDWAELGFGLTAVPAAADLLGQLRTVTSSAQQDRSNGGGSGSGGGRVDESWMEEAVGTTSLTPPESAEQLQVRVVESSGNASGGGGGAGGVSLAGLTGPMLLGSRTALAMPYDMLGIADSVDKMIEVMSRQQQGAGRAGGAGDEANSTEDESEPTSDDQDEGDQQGRTGAGAVSATVATADEALAQDELAALFGGGGEQAALRDGDALELQDLVSGLDGSG